MNNIRRHYMKCFGLIALGTLLLGCKDYFTPEPLKMIFAALGVGITLIGCVNVVFKPALQKEEQR